MAFPKLHLIRCATAAAVTDTGRNLLCCSYCSCSSYCCSYQCFFSGVYAATECALREPSTSLLLQWRQKLTLPRAAHAAATVAEITTVPQAAAFTQSTAGHIVVYLERQLAAPAVAAAAAAFPSCNAHMQCALTFFCQFGIKFQLVNFNPTQGVEVARDSGIGFWVSVIL